MAEGQDEDEREEELSSISAIFPELIRDTSNPFLASIDLPVSPSTPLLVCFSSSADGVPFTTVARKDSGAVNNGHSQNLDQDRHVLQHLPSLHVQITLPEGYPDEKPPQVNLATTPAWLPSKTLQQLQNYVSEMWAEYGHMQVVYAFIDYIQQAADRGFDLGAQNDGVLHLDQAMKISLLDFDLSAKRHAFEEETFECGICLDPKKGSLCYRISKCGHVFCIECLQDFYNNAIKEGDVTNVKCLAPNCGEEKEPGERRAKKAAKKLTPSELLQIPLEREMVQRYIDLKRKKKLESDKSTIYCPRTWCQGPARSKKYPKRTLTDLADEESDEETELAPPTESDVKTNPSRLVDRLRICEDCNYAFCHVCLGGWHGEFLRCWPRSNSDLTEEERASYNYIRMHTSPCPSCGSPCQKTHGCNHMNCYQCNSHFCYLCSSWLSPQNPYEHFNAPGKSCYQRLWELEEGDNADGHIRFDGIRGAEVAAAGAAGIEAAAQEDVNPQPLALGPLADVPAPVIPVDPDFAAMGVPEAIMFAIAHFDIDGETDSDSDDDDHDWRPPPVQPRDWNGQVFERRPAGQPRRRARRPALGGDGALQRGHAAEMDFGAQRR